MIYFAIVDNINNNIIDCGGCPSTNAETTSVEISEYVFNNIEKYIAIRHEEEIDVPDYDKETGEQTGTHTEIVVSYTIELNPDYDTEQLALLRQSKNTENDNKANVTLQKTFTINVGVEKEDCQFIYNEKTERNLNSSALGFLTGQFKTKDWTDEQGITVHLTAEDVAVILMTFDGFANAVWAKWGNIKQAINSAKTLAALQKIKIDYSEFENKEGEN